MVFVHQSTDRRGPFDFDSRAGTHFASKILVGGIAACHRVGFQISAASRSALVEALVASDKLCEVACRSLFSGGTGFFHDPEHGSFLLAMVKIIVTCTMEMKQHMSWCRCLSELTVVRIRGDAKET